MKKLILLTCLAALLAAGNAWAVIGWAGMVWPNHGASVIPTDPLDTYCQVWKGGVTDAAGQGADIEGFCEVSVDGAPAVILAAAYLADNGANDEYTVQIPQAMLAGAAAVSVHWRFHDLTDDTWWDYAGDQAGNPGPQVYQVVDVLPNDVEVGFRLCLSGEPTSGDVCVIGSDAAIGAWGTGVTMNDDGGGLYGVTVVFPAGSNPTFEYKYRKDGCSTWESVPNRIVTLPTDGTTYYPIPDPDSWNHLPIGCGLGTTLEEDKVVCLQVCLDGVDNSGGVCAVGSIAALDDWGVGAPMTLISPDLYQTCLTFDAGLAIPLTVEFKFKKDDCATWESVGNRSFTVDNSLPTDSTLTYAWDDGPGACGTVATDATTWDSLKSLYR